MKTIKRFAMKLVRFALPFLLIYPSIFTGTAQAGILDNILSRSTQARDRATEARNAAQESRDNMRDGLQKVTGQVREALNEAADDLVEEVAERREFRQAFLDPDDCGNTSECGMFRVDVVMLVEDLGVLSNALFVATGLETRIETSRLTTILGQVPGRALYPLYRAFSEELNIFDSNFVGTLSFAADNLESIENAVVSEGCDFILDDNNFPVPIPDAIRGTKITGSGMELVGGIFEAISTKSVTKEGAIWGWVGGNFQNNRLKNLGVKFTTAGKVLGKYSNIASTKLMRCTIKNDNEQILAALGTFDPDFSNLDAAVSSRASDESVTNLGASVAALASSIATRSSQDSIDALSATLQSLDLSQIDVAVSSRASQASVDAIATNIATAVDAIAENIANLDIQNLDDLVSSLASGSSVENLGEQILNGQQALLGEICRLTRYRSPTCQELAP